MRYRIRPLVLLLVAIVGLAGCGGVEETADLTADTMTVAVAEQGVTTVTTYTEGPVNAQGYLDPNLSSSITPSGNTYLSMCSGAPACATLINISIKGSALGSYATGTAGPSTQITYKVNNQLYSTIYSSTNGTVALTKAGAVGEKISGAFNVVVTLDSNSTDTRGISGTFSVTRDH